MVTWLTGRLWINKRVVVSSCCGSTDTHGYISLCWKRARKKTHFFFCAKCTTMSSRRIFSCCFYIQRSHVQKRSLCFRRINRMHRRKVTSQRPRVVATGCYRIQIWPPLTTVRQPPPRNSEPAAAACTSHAELIVAWHANTLAEAKRGKVHDAVHNTVTVLW